jgi:hypothetical protein
LQTPIPNAEKRSERAFNRIGFSSDSQVAPRATSGFSSTQLRDRLRSVFSKGEKDIQAIGSNQPPAETHHD